MKLHRQFHSWGVEVTGFGRPMGLGVDHQGRLLVTDMDCHALVRFNADVTTFQCHPGLHGAWGEPVGVREGRSSERPSRTPGGWNGPHAVTPDAQGRLLVTCYYTPMVCALAVDGSVAVLIGSDILQGPATSRVDAQGRILVAEYALNLLMLFDPAGSYLGRIGVAPGEGLLKLDARREGVPASCAAGGFDRPHMVISASDGSFLVADTWNHRLQRLSSTGEFMGCVVGAAGWHSQPSRTDAAVDQGISCPVALDLNDQDQLLVTAWGRNEVLLLGADGRMLPMKALPKLHKPYDARFFGQGVVIADTHHGRVLIIDNLD